MTWTTRQHHFDPADRARERVMGLIFDIQRFAIHDGPGIRTLVFMKGCPLRCPWCQNPESMAGEPEISYFASNCIACNACSERCAQGAIAVAGDGARAIDRARCNLCGKCLDTCYAGAINIVGRYLTVAEVLAEAQRDRRFYDNSGGGVTFSGGEPTAQPVFLEAALAAAHAADLRTAIETCGYVRWDTLARILRHTDLALYDIKHMDPVAHRRLTGVPNDLILANLRRIDALGVPVRVRLPLVPGYNDALANVHATAAFVAGLRHAQALDILPYHRLGEPKWRQLGRAYELSGLPPAAREHVMPLVDAARAYNVEVTVGG